MKAKVITNLKKQNTVLYFCIFMLFLISMGLWIGWDGRNKYIYDVLALIMLFTIVQKKMHFDFSKRNTIPLLALLIAFAIYGDLGFGLGTFLAWFIPCSIILLLNDQDRISCLEYIFKWFAFLMIPCILTYIIVQLVDIPSLGKIWVRSKDVYADVGYLLRDNYIFYCKSDYMDDIRFNGPFVEPGHVGMMSAFLLFADGYDMKKKETWILLFTSLFTFALSAYALVAIGFLLVSYSQCKISMRMVLSIIFGAIFIYLFAIFYNDGENMLNELIISRLEYDEEKGFVGNNRIFGETEVYYLSLFTDRDLLLHGYDADTVDYLLSKNSGGIGFAMWMVMNGVLGTIAAYVFYVFYALFAPNKKYALMALVFFILTFWQRSYPFWFSWIICYAYGITKNRLQFSKGKKA